MPGGYLDASPLWDIESHGPPPSSIGRRRGSRYAKGMMEHLFFLKYGAHRGCGWNRGAPFPSSKADGESSTRITVCIDNPPDVRIYGYREKIACS